LTIALALHALEAGLDHLHFDESIMIGTRAMSGSVAIRFRKRTIAASRPVEHALVHVDVDDLAPFSTCWRATLERLVVVAALISLRELGEPVTLVRSPTLTNSDVVVDVERLEARQAQAAGDVGTARGGAGDGAARRWRDVLRRGAAAAADDVDQARARELAEQRRPSVSGVSSYSPNRVGQAGVGVGAHEGVGLTRQLGSTYGRICVGAERAVEAEGERAARGDRVPERLAVWPDSVRPEASVIVPEIITGSVARRGSSNSFVDREQRGLGVERVEDGLDQQQVGRRLRSGLGLLVVGVDQLVEVTLR
jgi:hypothetical protein